MIHIGLLLVCLTGPARAQGEAKDAAKPKVEEPSKIVIMADYPIENRGFWTGEISASFPALERPDEAAASLAKKYPGTWKWKEIRDFHGDGLPVVLLVRGADSEVREDAFIVESLVLAKWNGKAWRELVRVSPTDGIVLNGDGPKRAPEADGVGYSVVLRAARLRVIDPDVGAPVQLWLKVKALDSKGAAVGKRAELFYSAEAKNYSFDAPKPR